MSAPAKGHNSTADNVAADRLRSFIERIERLEQEKADIAIDIREIFSEAKGNGFDPKTIRQVIRLRATDPDERQEQAFLLDTYLRALGEPPIGGTPIEVAAKAVPGE